MSDTVIVGITFLVIAGVCACATLGAFFGVAWFFASLAALVALIGVALVIVGRGERK